MNRITILPVSKLGTTCIAPHATRSLHGSGFLHSDQHKSEAKSNQKDQVGKSAETVSSKKPKKTQAQLDAELQAAMEGRSGDGGISGAELEGGKAVSMKRGVRDNMFRYI